MKDTPLILIVEDNQSILHNLKLLLEYNGYQPITATNGVEAQEALSTLDEAPDLILCDIMMPKMNGYQLYQKISNNSEYFLTPFIFLTAKTDPEDVRLAKKLGVDDYITKPFKKEDLLAIIKGKLQRNKKHKIWSKRIQEKLITSLKLDMQSSISEEDEEGTIFLIFMKWDEDSGPILETSFPTSRTPQYDLLNVGVQLFQTSVSIYGQTGEFESQGVMLKIANIDKDAYLFFDSIDDDEVRGGKRQFMLGTIAPKISYFESLRIKETLEEIGRHIIEEKDWDIEKYWQRIIEILRTPSI